MSIRVAVLGLFHEANSFAAELADEEFMQRSGVRSGDDLLAEYRGTATTMGGFLRVLESTSDIEIVPITMTTLVPRGVITRDALARRLAEFRDGLERAGRVDAVLAALHGAAVAEDVRDVDGLILQTIRDSVGADVVIGASLDLHANVSRRMCAAVDVLNTYRTNPHVDADVVAEEVTRIVLGTVEGGLSPTIALVQLPAVINILKQNTDASPMKPILAEARAAMRWPAVLSVSVAEGYPYADVEEMGVTIVVVTDGDPRLAEAIARELASSAWQRRGEFAGGAPDAAEALRRARALGVSPVLVLDTGDNIGGGSPGDSVALLREAIDADVASMLTIVVAPRAAAECIAAGVGRRVAVTLGGGWQEPLDVVGEVLAVGDGVWDNSGPVLHAGFHHFEAGPTAALRLDGGQIAVLISRAVLPLSPDQVAVLGLDVSDMEVVVAKGVHSPLAGYGPHVRGVIQAATPGVTSADLGLFDYRHRPRPLFPFEPDAEFAS